MNLLARHLIFCVALSIFPTNVFADKSDHKELSENRSKNYASGECAKVIESNPEAKKASYIINGMTDEYMLNPCGAKIWFVIELCDSIQATLIEIASYELYSSNPKDFTVYVSDIYPTEAWNLIGHFTAADSRTLQAFDLKQVGFGKFIRVELHSHYGNEHYCVISEVKVYGASMMEEYLGSDNQQENGNKTHKNHKIPKRKTSAYRVYRNMMTEPSVCGLTVEPSTDVGMPNVTVNKMFYEHKEQPILKPIVPQPTQPSNVTNRTAPLKPSIFVELGNKVKAMEASLKYQIEDIEKRLNEKNELVKRAEAKVTKLKLQFESFALIIITYYVYKLMLDIM
uniref:Protein osteopotentia n=1 Tax=Aceria tosichella TaxID=561515 RepID=A0A6G1SGU2_9ACAR